MFGKKRELPKPEFEFEGTYKASSGFGTDEELAMVAIDSYVAAPIFPDNERRLRVCLGHIRLGWVGEAISYSYPGPDSLPAPSDGENYASYSRPECPGVRNPAQCALRVVQYNPDGTLA